MGGIINSHTRISQIDQTGITISTIILSTTAYAFNDADIDLDDGNFNVAYVDISNESNLNEVYLEQASSSSDVSVTLMDSSSNNMGDVYQTWNDSATVTASASSNNNVTIAQY